MKQSDLRQRLFVEGHRFEFFQAVRLLERLATEHQPEEASDRSAARALPNQEAVRFRSASTLSFAAAPIQAIKPPQDSAPPEMVVTFMGLTGPHGVLPHHYTMTVIEQERNKQTSLGEFFNSFTHRLITLFYHAGQKYRLPLSYEDSKVKSSRGIDAEQAPSPWHDFDPFTSMLLSLVGLGMRGEQQRLTAGEELVLYYAGHYAHRPRNASALEQLLSDCFGVRAKVNQFTGRRLLLDEPDRSRLGRGGDRSGYCALGRSLVLGRKVWEVQSHFRVRLESLRYEQFCRFLPGSESLRHLSEMTRLFAGAEFDFDVLPVLVAPQVPKSRLGRKHGHRIGANFWLCSKPAKRDFDRRAFLPTPL